MEKNKQVSNRIHDACAIFYLIAKHSNDLFEENHLK